MLNVLKESDCVFLKAVLRIRIRKILASWIRIRIRKNMRIQNINLKLQQKNVTLKTQIWTIEKREIIKISWFLNCLSSFSIKISKKMRQKIWKFCFVKIFKEITWIWIRIHFSPVRIQDPDPHQNYLDPKHCPTKCVPRVKMSSQSFAGYLCEADMLLYINEGLLQVTYTVFIKAKWNCWEHVIILTKLNKLLLHKWSKIWNLRWKEYFVMKNSDLINFR